ncbi:MAG: hypothetical protein J6B97_01055 [Bacteroidales bacterium]|nr:hypothetical protein [Bacteroidales bacterium]
MKRIILSVLAMSALLCGCQKDHVSELTQERGTIQATIEEISATRTVMDENNNIRWSEGDQIVGFMRSTLGVKYQVSAASVGKTSASFEEVSSGGLNAGTELEHVIAYYPYSSSVSAAKSGSNYTLDVILPTEQTYVAGSFGNGAMPMVAVSETNNITFRNVCGGMKLQLKGTQKVVTIKVEGKNGELLSGAASVTAYTDETKPTITMASGASASVTLDCGSGAQLNESKSTEFIIALPPVLFSKGFTVTVTDDASRTYTVETDKANTVFRSSLLVMPEISIDAFSDEEEEPQEGDYIDEYGINHGHGIEIDGVVWAPVNCGYHATDYKYGKLYQWGRKYGQGYDNSTIGILPDKTFPTSEDNTIQKGPVELSVGNDSNNSDIFYKGSISDTNYDWLHPQNDKLWNAGTEENPIKTEYDPCPTGWRVPTFAELELLSTKSSAWSTSDGQKGLWFTGTILYAENVSKVFFSAVGLRNNDGNAVGRGIQGGYWSSKPYYSNACTLFFYQDGEYEMNKRESRAYGYALRCVKE